MLYVAHISRPEMVRSTQIKIEAKNIKEAWKIARQEVKKMEKTAKVTTVYRCWY